MRTCHESQKLEYPIFRMPTIWDSTARADLLRRYDKLNDQSRPQWGKFTVGRMVRHCADGVRMATGELAVKPKPGPFRNWLVGKLIIYVMPWPKGAPTAPELLSVDDPALDVSRSELRAALDRLVAIGPDGSLAEHAAFGKLSGKDWGVLAYRHLDHHLTQFGV